MGKSVLTDDAVRFFYAADITKVEQDGAGNLLVTGPMSSGRIDLERQVIDPDWLREEIPPWFRDWGNIREQHNPMSAVGKAKRVEIDAKPGPVLTAKIIDPAARQKVLEGVYNGFSVGIKNPVIMNDPTAPGGRIVGGQLIEVSVVDRPANNDCKFVLASKAARPGEWRDAQTGAVVADLSKREFSQDRRDDLADSGKAMPDGSFPIVSKQDLLNAIKAAGRAKGKPGLKQHILRRARALGLTNLLPEHWPGSTKGKEEAAMKNLRKSAEAEAKAEVRAKEADAEAEAEAEVEAGLCARCGKAVHPGMTCEEAEAEAEAGAKEAEAEAEADAEAEAGAEAEAEVEAALRKRLTRVLQRRFKVSEAEAGVMAEAMAEAMSEATADAEAEAEADAEAAFPPPKPGAGKLPPLPPPAEAGEDEGMEEEEQLPAFRVDARKTARKAAGDFSNAQGGQSVRRPGKGEESAVATTLRDIVARIEALGRSVDADYQPKRGNAPVSKPDFAAANPKPKLLAPAPLELSFSAKTVAALVSHPEFQAAVRRIVGEQYISKAAAASTLTTVGDVSKLAGDIAKGLALVAEQAEASAEELQGVRARMEKIEKLAAPAKGYGASPLPIDKGMLLQPDRVVGSVVDIGKSGDLAAMAEMAQQIAGLPEPERMKLIAGVLQATQRQK